MEILLYFSICGIVTGAATALFLHMDNKKLEQISIKSKQRDSNY